MGRKIGTRRVQRQVSRRMFGTEVPPALVRPARLPNRRHQFGIEYESAVLPVWRVCHMVERYDALAHLHKALDDPIDRPAIQNLRRPPGPVARKMAESALRLQAPPLRRPKLLDVVDSDAKLKNVKSHTRQKW